MFSEWKTGNLDVMKEYAMNRDLTHIIERLEAFEERLGLELRGLYAFLDENGYLWVNGELASTQKSELDCSICVVCTLYDSDGRVLDNRQYFADDEKFFGFESFSMSFDPPGKATASQLLKIRIYPKKW